ncbi:chitinase [Cryptococcus wingfieldii CBS 7118]|uniref:Chitinase n=1 Tax=Cryptococcus wingfieldii CBS 7118 TaxID=1295528 RepID=A0A1E3IHL4_9TREE|nr:chitinase [Cryptococcus wingfieldii CBS 7118]ODN88090.1 chitinase [Cryptococcus wingfieldii CBS 7118]
MYSTLKAATLFALLTGLAVQAAPAPQSGTSVTCDSDTQWHDDYQTQTCPTGTVCQADAGGNPCVWPSSGAATGVTSAAAATSAEDVGASASVAGGASSSAVVGGASSSAVVGGASSVAGGASSAGGQATSAGAASSTVAGSSGAAGSSASGVSGSSASGGSATSSAAASSGTASTTTNSTSSSGTRYVLYWDNYANMGGVEASQLTGATHVILCTIPFADMTSWATKVDSAAMAFQSSSDGNFDPSTASTLKGMVSGLKVTGALGGWGLDTPMATAVQGGESTIETLVDNAVAFAKAFDLDGIDIDWEFPAASDVPNLVTFLTKLKAGLPDDSIISVALGARIDTTDAAAYTSDTFSQLKDLVDMWNVMTYDYVNRYSDKTEQQGGGRVVETVMDYYEKQGIEMEKVNIGFAMNAKYFTGVTDCTTDNPIGCTLPGKAYYEDSGKDNRKSGWLRFNSDLDSTLGTDGTTWMEKVRPQFEKRPTDGSTEIADDVSQAWYDEDNQTFWTWLEPSDMSSVCSTWKSKVGGMMVWSANQ